MSHDQILFEGTKNGNSKCKDFIDIPNLGDIGKVGEYRRFILTIDFLKGIDVSGGMVICVVPPFN
jgi:hypothetical protein